MPRGHRPVPRASVGGDGGRTGRKQFTGRGRARPGPAPLAATPPSPSLTCMTRTIVPPPPRSSCSALGPEIFFYKVDWVGATRRSSPDEWIHKMRSIRTVEYYSAMKRKEVLRQG